MPAPAAAGSPCAALSAQQAAVAQPVWYGGWSAPDCAEAYERRLLLDHIETTLKANGLDEIARIYRLLLLGNTWAEVAEGLGYGTEESLKKKFHRAIHKVFHQASGI